MDYIIATIVAFAEWIWGLVKNVFTALWDVLTDGVAYVVDKMLSFAVSALNLIDTSGLQVSSSWGSLPAEMLNILGLVGFGQCMAIIGTAILIRLGLQLIPFVRLGS